MHEGFLKALLNHIFGILAAARNSLRYAENPHLVPSDEFFKRSVAPAFCRGDQFFFVVLDRSFLSGIRLSCNLLAFEVPAQKHREPLRAANPIPPPQLAADFEPSFLQARVRHVRDISATKALHAFLLRGGASSRPILVNALKMISTKIALAE